MSRAISLPAPTEDARAHSLRLSAHIARVIEQNSGWISFARYMELALYAPGLGYYSAGAKKFGAGADFVTAPEISALFGRSLARQAAQLLEASPGDVLECGAGSGKLALDLLTELEALGRLPRAYLILDLSGELQARQRELIALRAPHFLQRMAWLNSPPQRFTGLILGNEVLDAMPAHAVAWRDGQIFERGVVLDAQGYAWNERPLDPGPLLEAARAIAPGNGYVSEISLAAPAFARTLADILQQGAILFLDYGFGKSEYYHPQRARGTLMCHYRHYAHDDPFYYPGLQDITAHVNFSAIAQAGVDNGLRLLGYATQAQFLLNCGITELLSQTPADNAGAYLPLAAQAQKLLSPAEMGELFKVIAFGKGAGAPLLGFRTGDKTRLL